MNNRIIDQGILQKDWTGNSNSIYKTLGARRRYNDLGLGEVAEPEAK